MIQSETVAIIPEAVVKQAKITAMARTTRLTRPASISTKPLRSAVWSISGAK